MYPCLSIVCYLVGEKVLVGEVTGGQETIGRIIVRTSLWKSRWMLTVDSELFAIHKEMLFSYQY